MFKKIKEFFVGKPQVDVVAPGVAPYKLPEPVIITMPPVAAPAVIEVIVPETTVASVVVETPAPEKKARKPRVPKAAPVAEEKAPAKAKAPKVTKSKKV